MNKNNWKKDYSGVNSGLSKLAAEDAKRKGYTFKTKRQKKLEKAGDK